MYRLIALYLLVLTLVPPIVRAEGVAVVHTETVQVGPYALGVGFSRWPLNADRSLDIIFTPQGGISGLRGTVTLVSPTGVADMMPLTRHPRMREAWGLDVIALPEQGPWTLVFAIDGPAGAGSGRLTPLALGARPGPDAALSWLIGLLPLVGALAIGAHAWWPVRPDRHADAWRWV